MDLRRLKKAARGRCWGWNLLHTQQFSICWNLRKHWWRSHYPFYNLAPTTDILWYCSREWHKKILTLKLTNYSNPIPVLSCLTPRSHLWGTAVPFLRRWNRGWEQSKTYLRCLRKLQGRAWTHVCLKSVHLHCLDFPGGQSHPWLCWMLEDAAPHRKGRKGGTPGRGQGMSSTTWCPSLIIRSWETQRMECCSKDMMSINLSDPLKSRPSAGYEPYWPQSYCFS